MVCQCTGVPVYYYFIKLYGLLKYFLVVPSLFVYKIVIILLLNYCHIFIIVLSFFCHISCIFFALFLRYFCLFVLAISINPVFYRSWVCLGLIAIYYHFFCFFIALFCHLIITFLSQYDYTFLIRIVSYSKYASKYLFLQAILNDKLFFSKLYVF